MIALSNERIGQMLHEESVKKEDTDVLLRGIYIRYMRLYEKYFADIDALNDQEIAALRTYHQETRSLIRYYYLDIPQDVCTGLKEFEKRYSDPLLGPDWHKFLFDHYRQFRERQPGTDENSKSLRAAFAAEALEGFYAAMEYIFRDGFGTGSQAAQDIASGISNLLFGKKS